MDRSIVYDGELPATLDILNSNKTTAVGLSFYSAAMFGPSSVPPVMSPGTVVDGLACNPTVPTASMQITIAPGSIYQSATMDTTAYGDLGTDTAVLIKQGILYAQQTLTVSPPALSAGQSVNILVEAGLVTADDNSTVVEYYNAVNPASPLWGSNLAATQALGTPQNTTRLDKCVVQLKNGTAATTGSQTTPAADSGFIGLYVITVPVGFTAILSTYITSLQVAKPANGTEQLRSLPYFPDLPHIPPALQQSIWTYAIDTGAVNAMAAICYPLVTAYVAGLMCFIKVANTNTSTVTINLNGLGIKAVHRATGAGLAAGDLTLGEIVLLMYDGTSFQIVNFVGPVSSAQVNFFNTWSIAYGVDHGTPNNLQVSPTPAISSLTAGLVVAVKVANINTDATTLTLTGLPSVAVQENQLPLLPAAIVPNEIILLEYDGTVFQKQPARWPIYPYDTSLPPASGQVLMPDDQATITFSNVTSVPLAIPCVPGAYSIELIVTASNATKTDVFLLPNDVAGSGFSAWQTLWAGSFPTAKLTNNLPAFKATLGGNGPFMARIDTTTFTAAKAIRYFAAMAAGTVEGAVVWQDTTTPWTSLGTLIVSLSGGVLSPPATITGVAIVRREG